MRFFHVGDMVLLMSTETGARIYPPVQQESHGVILMMRLRQC